MAVEIEYTKSADQVDHIITTLRETASEKCKVEIAKANAYREGYVTALFDLQDRILRYRTVIKEEGAKDENA